MEDRIERFWHRAYFNLEKGYLRACIDRAYLDFCRTIDRKKYQNKEWKEIKEKLALILLREIQIMLTKTMDQEEFDQWHHHAMLHLISMDDIDMLISHNNYLTFGQAQKWVNMSLKYIYAVGDKYIPNACVNSALYHIPIDSIIQKKLEEYGVPPLDIAWSKLNTMWDYEVFQRKCRSTFPKRILIDVEMDLFNEIS